MARKKNSESSLPIIRVSVRDLVEFVLRTGGLGRESIFMGPRRALEGSRAHQRIQKSRPADYEAEVFLTRDITTETLTLRISGRIDGLIRSLDQWHIEEIKTLSRPHDGEPDPLHWAQARMYGAMLAFREPSAPNIFEFQLTYLELATGKFSEHRQTATRSELESFFQQVVAEYLTWAEDQAAWEKTRNDSIATLEFPFSEYRAGQRALAVAVYRTIRDQAQLIAEAPTGIGKTVSVLYPAIKALAEGKARKIFYLTARTIGRAVAQETVALLRSKGARVRSLALTARDKICFKEAETCDALECPYATAYYDRIKPALRAALKEESLDRGAVEALARRHSVCPFELSLDIARWADVIICDYNYAFDPGSYLRRFFDDDPGGYIFLVDEAHNLPDRARDMFSAEFSTVGVREDLLLIHKSSSDAAAGLKSLANSIETLSRGDEIAQPTVPEHVVSAAKDFLAVAERQLIRNEAGPAHERLLQRYFEATRFLRTAENYDNGYATIITQLHEAAAIRLFCADPTNLLKETLQRADSTIFFSATLSPLQYFAEILHGPKPPKQLQLPSPFPPQNLSVIIHRKIDTTLKQRSQSADAVAAAIVDAGAQKIGNYLVYFSSFQYLQDVFEKVRRLTNARLLAQSPQMSEPDRETFLKSFAREPTETQIGFAVLGGIFGEGIDLVGDRLIGAIIVGVGLPQLCLERDLISERFAARQLDGYDFAYRFPGMNRVLQAAGRVIRTEKDRGFVLLIDRRFAESRYRQLM
ncbi:MAG TPA: ATP-dependent DNA helicase, partial [Verrucomicrobiae bacterium]|nr:ATP-dependent DNA helicase [Verrucomicrobiae bacterium]